MLPRGWRPPEPASHRRASHVCGARPYCSWFASTCSKSSLVSGRWANAEARARVSMSVAPSLIGASRDQADVDWRQSAPEDGPHDKIQAAPRRRQKTRWGSKKGTLFAPVKIAFETGKVLAINKTSQGRLRCKHRSQNEPPRKSAPKPTPRLHHPHWRDRNRLLFMGIWVV